MVETPVELFVDFGGIVSRIELADTMGEGASFLPQRCGERQDDVDPILFVDSDIDFVGFDAGNDELYMFAD